MISFNGVMARGVILLAILSLAGCTPLGGAAYKVKFSSPASVAIVYNPSLIDDGAIQQVAQQNCTLYGKDALPDVSFDRQAGFFSHKTWLTYESFECQDSW
jgi:hypothetical protein